MSEVVGIHPEKAALLATTLSLVATALDCSGRTLLLALREVGEDDQPARAALDAAAWASREHRAVRAVVDEILAWEATGERPPGVLARSIWRDPMDPAFADPGPAMVAAGEAEAALRAHDGERFAALVARWGSNPVFAHTLLRALGPHGLAAALVDLELRLTGARGTGATTANQDALVHGLSTAYATATRFWVAPFRLDDVVGFLEDARLPVKDVALLFRHGDVVFEPSVLLDAYEQVVVRLNRQLLEGAVTTADLVFGSGDGAIDARALVLSAVARDANVSNVVVDRSDLAAVADGRYAYRDGGVALGAVLLAGTAPTAGPGQPNEHRSAARRLIGWVAERAQVPDDPLELQPGTLRALAQVVAPYLGAFRADDFDRGAVPDPLGDLREADARAFLGFVAADLAAMGTLRREVVVWAARELDAAARAGAPGRVLSEVADVSALVADAAHGGRAEAVIASDEAYDAERAAVSDVISMLTSPLPFGSAISSGLDRGIDAQVPDLHLTADELRDVAHRRSADQALLESLWIGLLWKHRATNGVFDALPPLPEDLLLDGGERVRTWAEMDPPQRRAMLRWLRDREVAARTGWEQIGAELGLAGAVERAPVAPR